MIYVFLLKIDLFIRIILNNYLWHPVQSTFERVKNSENSYISIELILEQLNKVTSNIHTIDAPDLANKAGNPLTSNVVLLGSLAKLEGFPINKGPISVNTFFIINSVSCVEFALKKNCTE